MIVSMSFARAAWRAVVAGVLLAGSLAPVGIAPVAAQAELPATAAAAPESTIFFEAIDLDLAGAQWQQTDELLARVGVTDALEQWRQAVLTEGAQEGDFTAADLDALLGGELAVAVTPDAIAHIAAMHEARKHRDDATPMAMPTDTALGVTVILAPGDPAAAWAYVERQMEQFATERNRPLQESSHGSGNLLVLEPGQGHEDKQAETEPYHEIEKWMGKHGRHGDHGFVAGQAGDFIVAGATQQDVTNAIDVIDGNQPSLAEAAAARDVVAALPSEALAFVYVDGAAIVDAIGEEAFQQLQESMPDLSRDALRGQLGVALGASDAGFRFDSIAIPAAGGSFSTGVTGNDPEVAAAASRVPAESFFYEAGVVPPNAFAQAPYYLALAVNAAASGQDFESGEGLEQLPSQAEIDAQIAQAEAILGFDPRGELFDLLGGRFILFSTLPSFGGEGLSIDVAAAVDTSDATTLSATFDRLATLLGGMDPNVAVAERAVGASTVHAVSDSSNAMVPAVEFGVVDDQAVVGVGAGIDQLATPQGATLADDPQFQAVMAALPADYQQITYVNVGQVIDLLAALFGQIEADISGTAATPAAATGSPDAIRALAAVVYQHEQGVGTSAILYIEG